MGTTRESVQVRPAPITFKESEVRSLKLLTMTLRNFKGIKNFALEAGGGNVNIYGENATGKTTLFDAFTWLFFDKDSANRKDFEIKTLDKDNQPLHGLDHEVEAELEVNGKSLNLHKIYKEKWTKKRGSATAEFTGHTTDYFIDSVPVKKSEYEAKIAKIADEEVFKLVTNPTYFNEQLHWQNRRKILLQICGDISDEDVIASDPALSKLPEILKNRKLEDHRKIITARRSEINKELDRIPVRIDEVQRSLPDISDINQKETFQTITNLKETIKDKEQQIVRIESGGEIAEKIKSLREIEGQLLDIKNQYRSRNEAAVIEKQKQLNDARGKAINLKSNITATGRSLVYNQKNVQELEERMENLRQEWHQVNNQQFEYEQSDTCPTCGQPLPAEKLIAAQEKALVEFNRKKAEHLESITAQGKHLKAQADDIAGENAKTQQKLQRDQVELEAIEEAVTGLQKEIETMQAEMEQFAKDPTYITKLQEKQNMEAQVTALKEGRHEETAKIQAEIAELESQVRTAENRLADIQRHKQGQQRIEELKKQERALAAEYEKLEGELYLTEQFVRSKVSLLEERINSRFQHARFKLFDVQINGGVVETCETIYKGVPYSTGLNNAAKINVGLDIINTLSDFYGFSAPIFIDNREAVTKLIKTKGQVISLIVSETDDTLRVETEQEAQATLFREVI